MELLDYKKDQKELSFINSDFPFCFSKEYFDYISDSSSSFYILKHKDFIAPIIIKKSKFLKTIQFQYRPLTLQVKNLDLDDETEFLNSACTFIKKNHLADRIIQPQNFSLFFSVPNNSIKAPFGTYEIALSSRSKEELLLNMQARYRTVIRATEKLNPIIKIGKEELFPFWQLHKETLSRTHMYFESFDTLKKQYDFMQNQVLIANCYIQNELQGGVYIVYTKYGAYYLHGASSETTVSDGAIKYLHYWCMNYLKEKNVLKYDFVGARLTDISGTKLEGIQNFKKRFGSTLITGYLWKKDIFPFTCLAYDSLLNLKLKLKSASSFKDIIDQERKKLNEL